MVVTPAGTAMLRRLLTSEGLADPYAVYREMRAVEDAGGQLGPVFLRYEDARDVLYGNGLLSNRVSAILRPLPTEARARAKPLEDALRDIVVFLDQPDHVRVRKLLSGAFSPRMVERSRPVIERAADRLLDDLADGSVVDLHADLAYPLPAIVVGFLLGIPDEDLGAFRAWAADLVEVVGSGRLAGALAERATGSMVAMRALLAGLVSQRRREPGLDLMSAMTTAIEEGDRLTEEELYANALFLMTAGHETAANMLSNGVLTLLRHPEQLDLLRRDHSLVGSATEEILRYEGPVQIAARVAAEDRVVSRCGVRAGDPVIVMLGAANRDPAQFPDPDRFDITRSPNPHLAFSHGPHFCLGARLARVEMEVVLRRLFDRFPHISLAEERISWQPTLDFRGPARLLVRL